MKRLLIVSIGLCALIASTVFISNIKDVKAPPEIVLQLGNTGNVYSNTITKTNVGTGLLLDTTSNTTPLYLQTCNYAFLTSQSTLNSVLIPHTNSDTLYPMNLKGYNYINFFAKVLKCTGTDTIVITPVQSVDGEGSWDAVPGLTSATLTPTSLTVPLQATWTQNSSGLPIMSGARHYGLKFVGNGSSTMSVTGWVRDVER
jgi:hypothetical protein